MTGGPGKSGAMHGAGEAKGKGKKRRALKRANAELAARLAAVGAQLDAAEARAAAFEAQKAETAARLDAAAAEWEAQRRRFDAELHALGEDVGNALADRAAAVLRAEEEGKAALDRLTVERGELAVELSKTREALAAALAETEQLQSHVAQLRAALDDATREPDEAAALRAEIAPLREEIGIALAARAAAELRLEQSEKSGKAAVTEVAALRPRLAELEAQHAKLQAERETLLPKLADLQERVVQASTELNEAVLEHNRQMAAWYAERDTAAAQRARLAAEADAVRTALARERDERAGVQQALDEAAAAAEAAHAEIAALNEARDAQEAEIARLAEIETSLGEKLDAKAVEWGRIAAAAADLIDADAAEGGDPLDLLAQAWQRLREMEVALDRAEVERDRLDADLAARIAAEQASPWRRLPRILRHLLPRRLPVSASGRAE